MSLLKNQLCQEKKCLTQDQLSKLKQLNQEFGYQDEKLNQFKLMIYDWNINNVIEYYENDSFCVDFCIGLNDKHGCRKPTILCPFEHSLRFNLAFLIFGNQGVVTLQNYKMGRILCLYLMNKKVYNDNNAQLFMYYGELLHQTGTRMQDYIKSQQYFLKSLNIDNNNDTSHYKYAALLDEKLHNVVKAEYHYRKSLEIDPNNGIRNYNFAMVLAHRLHKYNEGLIYANKACEFFPNSSDCPELKGQILYKLNKFEEAIDETIHALKLNEKDSWMTNFGTVNTAKQLIEQSIDKYMREELKMQSYFNHQEFEGYKLMEWLYDNQLLSIKKEIFSHQISLEILSQCDEEDLGDLLKEMKLKTTTRVRLQKAFEPLQQPQQDLQDEHVESKDEKKESIVTTETTNLVSQLQREQSDEPKIDSVSAFSGISAISSPFVVNGSLIVFLGVGDYEDLSKNLPGVSKDYQNILHTFVETWGYTAFYKTDKNFGIYSNEIETVKLNNNYKLHWTIDEIDKFLEEARMYVVFNKHNGLIFVISSHGDTGKIVYDSKMKEYSLSHVFNTFQPEWGQKLKTYKETSQVSKRLFHIPKIFCIDSCRVSSCATISNTKSTDEKDDEKVGAKSNVNNNSSNNNNDTQKSDSEQISFKVLTKKKSQVLSSNYSNLCKIWANVDRYAVADGSLNGGLFLRNVAKLFQHKKWILNHNLNDIIFKIRECTKREATLMGLVNFTQLVENEATMERPVRFDVFKENIVYKTGQDFVDEMKAIDEVDEIDEIDEIYEESDGDDGSDKILIANLSSRDKIAVLVENERNNEDRTTLLESSISNDSLFTSQGYQLIAPANTGVGIGIKCAKFVKTWDYTFVTLINVTKKELVCDRKPYFENYLYFEDDDLQRLSQYKTKCNNKNGAKHKLQEINLNDIENHEFKCHNCASIKSNVYFHCNKCEYSLCQNCCHIKVCAQKQQKQQQQQQQQ